MKPVLISLLTASLFLGGCTAQQQADARAGWQQGVANGHAFRDNVLLPALTGLAQGAGQAMVAYGDSVAEYEATHPTIYVQPSYVPSYQFQQHGTMILTSPSGGPGGTISY